jgi:hypothetical protein
LERLVLGPYMEGLDELNMKLLFLVLDHQVIYGNPDAITTLRTYPQQVTFACHPPSPSSHLALPS